MHLTRLIVLSSPCERHVNWCNRAIFMIIHQQRVINSLGLHAINGLYLFVFCLKCSHYRVNMNALYLCMNACIHSHTYIFIYSYTYLKCTQHTPTPTARTHTYKKIHAHHHTSIRSARC